MMNGDGVIYFSDSLTAIHSDATEGRPKLSGRDWT